MNWFDALFLAINAFFLYVTLVFLLTFLENRERALSNPKPKRFPSVSIVIPAFNEEDTIAATMRAAAKMSYPKRLEIIVVDDGSTDGTLREARAAAAEIARKGKAVARVLTQRNAGKAMALNAGISAANGELVATVDADSFPHEDALLKIVGYFNDSAVQAVTASTKIHQPKNLLQFIQFVEYVSMNFFRKTASFMQGIGVVPGPLSVFRASVFKKIGGFEKGNIAEDAEFALRLQKNGMRIENALDAVVDCDTPYSITGLVKQRMRWYHGALVNAGKYSNLFFNRKIGAFGWFVYPTNFIAVIFAIFVFFRVLLMAWQRAAYLIFGAVSNSAGAAAAVAGGSGSTQPAWWTLLVEIAKTVFNPNTLLTMDVAFVVIYLTVVIFALWLSFKTTGERFRWRLLPVYIGYLFVYSFLVTATWIISVLRFASRAKPVWGTKAKATAAGKRVRKKSEKE